MQEFCRVNFKGTAQTYFMAQEKAKLHLSVFILLFGLKTRFRPLNRCRGQMGGLEHPGINLKRFQNIRSTVFEKLKYGRRRAALWNPVFNSPINDVGEIESSKSTSRYDLTI